MAGACAPAISYFRPSFFHKVDRDWHLSCLDFSGHKLVQKGGEEIRLQKVGIWLAGEITG
jgi:hypothetical protein